jgi:hypothetical protein
VRAELTFLVVRDSEGTPAGRSSASTEAADLIWMTIAQYSRAKYTIHDNNVLRFTEAKCCFAFTSPE